MNNSINVGFHTKYIPIGKKEAEVSDYVCGCLFNNHFSAILPWRNLCHEFKPRDNLFSFLN